MQELIEYLRSLAFDKKLHLGMGDIFLTQGHIDELEEKYIEKEKEQIEEAYSQGYGDGVQEPNPNDEYYKQTYKQLK